MAPPAPVSSQPLSANAAAKTNAALNPALKLSMKITTEDRCRTA
jgi:hypothetical protein